jgi:hypothetical protein
LDNLLTELEQFGCDNDRATAERPRKMLNITRDTGEFLAVLVRATLARRVLRSAHRMAIRRFSSRSLLWQLRL